MIACRWICAQQICAGGNTFRTNFPWAMDEPFRRRLAREADARAFCPQHGAQIVFSIKAPG
jgi:hypothetical protein